MIKLRGKNAEEMKREAEMILQELALLELIPAELPGEFVYSPPNNSRLVVNSFLDLCLARDILRQHYGWEDMPGVKFYSSGSAIAVFMPLNKDLLPIKFDLWFEQEVTLHTTELDERIFGTSGIRTISKVDYEMIKHV